MSEQLLHFDRRLFYLINSDLSNPFFDWIMPLMRNPLSWIPLYLFIIFFCIWRYKRQGLVLMGMLLLCVGFTDLTSAGIIKKQVLRVRPCRDMITSVSVISRVPCGTGYSFPSTHAADHFAIAAFLSSVFYKKWRWVLPLSMLWAAVICFAQVYVGVHFPLDVTGGAVYGLFTGWLFVTGFTKLKLDFKYN